MNTESNNNDMPREEALLVFAYGTLEGLINLGLVEGPKMLTQDGLAQYQRLKKSGFTPSEDEMNWAMAVIMHQHSNQ